MSNPTFDSVSPEQQQAIDEKNGGFDFSALGSTLAAAQEKLKSASEGMQALDDVKKVTGMSTEQVLETKSKLNEAGISDQQLGNLGKSGKQVLDNLGINPKDVGGLLEKTGLGGMMKTAQEMTGGLGGGGATEKAVEVIGKSGMAAPAVEAAQIGLDTVRDLAPKELGQAGMSLMNGALNVLGGGDTPGKKEFGQAAGALKDGAGQAASMVQGAAGELGAGAANISGAVNSALQEAGKAASNIAGSLASGDLSKVLEQASGIAKELAGKMSGITDMMSSMQNMANGTSVTPAAAGQQQTANLGMGK